MARIHGEIVIARPVEEVFDFVADERNEPKYNPQMTRVDKTTAGPIGVGSRFEAETRTRGAATTMTIQFTEFERPRRLASLTRLSPMDIAGLVTFQPTAEGTLLRWDWDLRPRGFMKLLSPLVARMGRRQEETNWANLKRYLETQAG